MAEALYLSRLVPDPRSREVQRDFVDCVAMHRTLMSAFPDALSDEGRARAEAGLLYRVDSMEDRPLVIVQSTVSPDWSRLPGGWTNCTASPETKEISQFLSRVAEGQRIRFRIVANPTRKICPNGGANGTKSSGKRVELRGKEEWVAWLARKGLQHGFRVVTVNATVHSPSIRGVLEKRAQGRRRMPDGTSSRLTFFGVAFEGWLEVVNQVAFFAAIRSGIGSGKAYGYGLLSVAPG